MPFNKISQQDSDMIAEVFSYHAPSEDDARAYNAIRSFAREFADILFQYCPPCADRTAAFRKIREAVMTANAAIALKGKV